MEVEGGEGLGQSESILQQVIEILGLKDTHNLSQRAIADLLLHRWAWDEHLPEKFPKTFPAAIKVLEEAGYVDPTKDQYFICAGQSHCTIFRPESDQYHDGPFYATDEHFSG